MAEEFAVLVAQGDEGDVVVEEGAVLAAGDGADFGDAAVEHLVEGLG